MEDSIKNTNYFILAFIIVAFSFVLKGDCLPGITSISSNSNSMDNSSAILGRALEIIELIENKDAKSQALTDIASTYIAIGKYEKAVKAAGKIEDFYIKSRILADIGYKSYKDNNSNGSEILAQSLEIANNIDEANSKAKAFIYISDKYTKIDKKDKASEALSNALEAAKTIKDGNTFYSKRIPILSKIATKYIDIDQPDKANQISKMLDKKRDEELVLSNIADKYLEIGNFTKAIDITKNFNNKQLKSEKLANIASKYVKYNLSKNQGNKFHNKIDSLEYIVQTHKYQTKNTFESLKSNQTELNDRIYETRQDTRESYQDLRKLLKRTARKIRKIEQELE